MSVSPDVNLLMRFSQAEQDGSDPFNSPDDSPADSPDSSSFQGALAAALDGVAALTPYSVARRYHGRGWLTATPQVLITNAAGKIVQPVKWKDGLEGAFPKEASSIIPECGTTTYHDPADVRRAQERLAAWRDRYSPSNLDDLCAYIAGHQRTEEKLACCKEQHHTGNTHKHARTHGCTCEHIHVQDFTHTCTRTHTRTETPEGDEDKANRCYKVSPSGYSQAFADSECSTTVVLHTNPCHTREDAITRSATPRTHMETISTYALLMNTADKVGVEVAGKMIYMNQVKGDPRGHSSKLEHQREDVGPSGNTKPMTNSQVELQSWHTRVMAEIPGELWLDLMFSCGDPYIYYMHRPHSG